MQPCKIFEETNNYYWTAKMIMKQEILTVWPQNIANMFIKCEIIIVWSQNTGSMFIKQEIIGFLESGLSFWKIAFEIGLHA